MKGRGTKDELGTFYELRTRIGTDYIAYWVAWKYAPDILPEELKTFEDLCNHYKAFAKKKLTERECEKFLYYEKVQNAIRWLLRKKKNARMIELYNLYYEKAKEDPSTLKEFLKIQDIFFQDDEDSELESILRGQNFDDDSEDEEEYNMEI